MAYIQWGCGTIPQRLWSMLTWTRHTVASYFPGLHPLCESQRSPGENSRSVKWVFCDQVGSAFKHCWSGIKSDKKMSVTPPPAVCIVDTGRMDQCFNIFHRKFWLYHLNIAVKTETRQTRHVFHPLWSHAALARLLPDVFVYSQRLFCIQWL